MESKTSIKPSELKQLLEQKKSMMVLDVRNKDEYSEKHLPFAGNLPVEIIEAGKFIPEPGKIIITACGKGGGRSERAANYLRNNTTNEVFFLEGGTFGWLEKQ